MPSPGAGETSRCSGMAYPAASPEPSTWSWRPTSTSPSMRGRAKRLLVKAAAESVCVGVEQPGTYWFEYGARYTSYGPLAIDINRRGVTELRRRGVEAYRLHPGYYSGWDAWGGAAATDRPRDVLFLGSLTHRRAQILSQSAPILAQWTCDLRLFRGDQPVRDGTEGFVSGHAKHELLAGSRVLLNVHQGERDYFEWIRILEAISNGCLVLTERSGGYAPLVPGRHFIQAPAAALAAQVDGMLRDEALRAELALGAYEFVRKSMDWVDNVDRLLTLVERRLSRGAAPADRAAPATPLPETFRRAGRRAPVAPPSAPSAPPAAKSQVSALFDQAEAHEKQGRSMIKGHLAGRGERLPADRGHHCRAANTARRSTRRSPIPRPISGPRRRCRSSSPTTTIRRSCVRRSSRWSQVRGSGWSSSWSTTTPSPRSWSTCALSSPTMNGSRSASSPMQPIRARRPRATSGPAMPARRSSSCSTPTTCSTPRGPSCSTPRSDQSDAAFAYGLIEKFGQNTGLLSAVPWNVEHLVRSNYIDTMALIRREVWDEFGGFDPQVAAMGGYDDYAFWLQLAAVGYRGQLVSSFIGRYRVHGTSLQSLLNLDTKEFMQSYRERHPSLPWPALEGS